MSGDREIQEKIKRAIKMTEYKYFGDYEFTPDQRDAVDTLVDAAQGYLALLAKQEGGK